MSDITDVKKSEDGHAWKFVQGVISGISETKRGKTGNRSWHYQGFKIETDGTYVYGTVWGCDDISHLEGQLVVFKATVKQDGGYTGVTTKFNKDFPQLNAAVMPYSDPSQAGAQQETRSEPYSHAKPVGGSKSTAPVIRGDIAGWGIQCAISAMRAQDFEPINYVMMKAIAKKLINMAQEIVTEGSLAEELNLNPASSLPQQADNNTSQPEVAYEGDHSQDPQEEIDEDVPF